MSDPAAEDAHTVGPDSAALGQACYLCKQPFRVGERITMRIGRPQLGGALAALALHVQCLQNAALEPDSNA